MQVQVKHAHDIVYRATDEILASAIEAELSNVITVTLCEVADWLFQFIDVPPEDVLFRTSTDHIVICCH